MLNRFLSLLSVLLFLNAATAHADSLVGSQKTGSLSVAHFNKRLKTVFGELAPTPISQPTDLYKIRYRSQDAKGRGVILSGLLAVPRQGAPQGMVVFNHGTIADRRLSPSRFMGEAKPSEAESATLAFASGGYAVAMPDYLGLGDDNGVHPFPLGRINSRSAVDIIGPARSAAHRLKIAIGPHLFVTGYSEGGAVAMWTVRDLDQKPAPATRVVAAAPMAGPYDLTGVTAESLLSPAANSQIFVGRLYLLAYMLHSIHKDAGVRLSDYFVPAMALVVSHVFDKGLSDEQIIKRLALAATLLGPKNSMDRVTTRRLREAVRTRDPADPVMRDLFRNDCYDWVPWTKMLLVCLQSDPIVASANTQRAVTAMRTRGVSKETLQEDVITDTRLNHVTAIVPSLIRARRFFDRGGHRTP